ncbi:MAG TPA: 2Fe-2S iron-sulfur cluster binding domain-containing protein [Aeromonadales bacterium]|nr:2Fe-2S iron-sulfur cluster binding domain-containing protein [Aeromonadales bacterium]
MYTSLNRYEVVIEETGESFYCKEGQTILSAMAAMGKRGIPSGCHGGGCGVCKIQIIEGEVETKSMSSEHVSKTDFEQRKILACRTMPSSDVCLKVIGKMSKNVLKPPVIKKYGII